MKVVQIGPYAPTCGGVQRNMVGIRTLLSRQGMASTVINASRYRHRHADGVFYPRSPVDFVRLLAGQRADIVHAHFGGMLTRQVLGMFLACQVMPGRKTVLTFHSGGYPTSPEGQALTRRSVAARILRRFDRIVAVNGEIAAFLERLGVSPDRIRLIAPHAFLQGEDATSAMPEALRAFFERHSPVMISVGLLEPEYDLHRQIAVLDDVRRRHPRAGLVMIGSGALEGELRQAIAAKPYAGHVLLTGDVPHAATMRAIAEADVMLRTTLFDGDAISVRESLHVGTPVVGTDNGMRPPGVSVVPIADSPALLQGIERVLAVPRPAGQRVATPDERNILAVLDVYRELTAHARPSTFRFTANRRT